MFYKVCDAGSYGQSCNSTCGQCLDQEPCHHVNGTCIEGCDPGFKGNMCNKRM